MRFNGQKTAFGRHETFALRFGWLTKGAQALMSGDPVFEAEDATVRLGVGKNMVSSIRYWLQAARRAFIRRLTKDSGTDEEWFANVLLFLGQKPAKKWNDADAEGAEYRLAEFVRRIHDLDKLRVHYDGQRHATDAAFKARLRKKSSIAAAEQGGGSRPLLAMPVTG